MFSFLMLRTGDEPQTVHTVHTVHAAQVGNVVDAVDTIDVVQTGQSAVPLLVQEIIACLAEIWTINLLLQQLNEWMIRDAGVSHNYMLFTKYSS